MLLVCLLATPVLAQEKMAQRPVITIAADEWCPINCNPQSEQPGIGIEIAKAVFVRAGYRVNYVVMPWKEALAQVREGKVDAVVGASKSDDPGLVFPVSSLYSISDDFYVLSGNPWRYQGMQSLVKRRVGVIEGYGYGNVIAKYISENRRVNGAIFFASGEEALKENIDRLLAGKIDVLVESRAVMDYTLRQLALSDRIIWAGGVMQGPVYLAFSPALAASRQRAQQLDAGYLQLRNSGQLQRMYNAYGLKP